MCVFRAACRHNGNFSYAFILKFLFFCVTFHKLDFNFRKHQQRNYSLARRLTIASEFWKRIFRNSAEVFYKILRHLEELTLRFFDRPRLKQSTRILRFHYCLNQVHEFEKHFLADLCTRRPGSGFVLRLPYDCRFAL